MNAKDCFGTLSVFSENIRKSNRKKKKKKSNDRSQYSKSHVEQGKYIERKVQIKLVILYKMVYKQRHLVPNMRNKAAKKEERKTGDGKMKWKLIKLDVQIK